MAVFGCLHVPPLVVRVMKGRMKGQAFAEFPCECVVMLSCVSCHMLSYIFSPLTMFISYK